MARNLPLSNELEAALLNMEKKRRVLLVYITKVSGHRQATVALQQALRQLAPNIEAPSINGFGYTYPILEQVINRAYMGIIKRTPKVWDYLYDNPKVFKKSEPLKNFLNRSSHKKLAKLFTEYKPDTVVCTQAFPCGMIADYKMAHKLDVKIFGVLTDYAPHSYWINKGVDYYIVPNEEAKERFISKGVNPHSIKVLGIPIRSRFALKLDKDTLKKKMGLNSHIPTVLIMGGGQGLGPIKTIVKSLINIQTNFQIIVLAGINKKLIENLRKFTRHSTKKIIILEYSTKVDELMEAADLIITKPGGLTTSECLAKGLPMVIVNPIPGQEMRNTDFLLQKGIAIRIDETKDIGEEIELLLKSPQRLQAMSQAAYRHAKAQAATDIAKLILEN